MIIIFRTIKSGYEISLNFSTNTIMLETQFRSKLILTVKSVQNTNSVPLSCILHKILVEGPVKQLLHPSWVCKIRKFTPCSPAWPTEFMVCKNVHVGARNLPAFNITGSWAEDPKLFHWKHIHGTQKCPTVCYSLFLSCVLFKQRWRKGENMNHNTTHTTA